MMISIYPITLMMALFTTLTFFSCQVSTRQSSTSTASSLTTYEWDSYAIPVTPGMNKRWVLSPSSDDFEYKALASHKTPRFFQLWDDYYHAPWSGPAPTLWRRDHVWVGDGMLRFKVSRPDDVPLVSVKVGEHERMMPGTYAGCISSKQRVNYPSYIEAYAKVPNSTMACAFWLLSPDDTQEIDIIEAYGSDRVNRTYGPDRLHLSHHVFVREPFQDYQPQDFGSWYRNAEGTLWRDDFHRVGVYWKSPTHLEYYVDGELVRVVSGMDLIDPRGYTQGKGLHKAMDIIINMEDQSWRAIKEPSLSPTNSELSVEQDHEFQLKWIRVYHLEDIVSSEEDR